MGIRTDAEDFDDIPGIEFEQEEEDIEVLIGNHEETPTEASTEPDPEKVAIQGRLEELERSLQMQREQVDLVGAVRELASSRNNAQQQPVQRDTETEEEFHARLNESWVDDPYKCLVEFNQKKIAPLAQELLASNVFHSRRDVERDPDRKETYAKYKDEIEAEVNSIPPEQKLRDPEVFAKAHDRVIGRHINEVIALKVEEALKGKSTTAGETVTAPPVSHSERGGGGLPPKKKSIKLTPAQAEQAAAIGMNYVDYYAFLQRQKAKQGGMR